MPDAISAPSTDPTKKLAAEQAARAQAAAAKRAQAAAAKQERSHRLASADKWLAARRDLERAVHDANQDFSTGATSSELTRSLLTRASIVCAGYPRSGDHVR